MTFEVLSCWVSNCWKKYPIGPTSEIWKVRKIISISTPLLGEFKSAGAPAGRCDAGGNRCSHCPQWPWAEQTRWVGMSRLCSQMDDKCLTRAFSSQGRPYLAVWAAPSKRKSRIIAQSRCLSHAALIWELVSGMCRDTWAFARTLSRIMLRSSEIQLSVTELSEMLGSAPFREFRLPVVKSLIKPWFEVASRTSAHTPDT